MADFEYFNREGDMVYAGVHLFIDLWQAERLDDIDLMRTVLLESVEASGATLRNLDLFQFSKGGGIAAVAMLTQSHISVHSWPEAGYCAVDAFMCGRADPHRILPLLQRAFEPGRIQVTEHKRGVRRLEP